MAASRAAIQNFAGRQAESGEIDLDTTGVDLEVCSVDAGKLFEQDEKADEHSVDLWTGQARCNA